MNLDPYNRLKEEIVHYVGTIVDSTIKQYFRTIISNRSLHRLVSFEELFKHLEDADYLCDKNVSYLKVIADLLNNRCAIDLIRTYNKLYGLSEEYVCDLCANERLQVRATGTTVLAEREEGSADDIHQLLVNRPKDLIRAIETLSLRLGHLWPVLLRELGFKEGFIQELRKNYRNDFQKQALKALDYWSIDDPDASLHKLHVVLSSSECRRRGFKPQLTQFEPYVKLLM